VCLLNLPEADPIRVNDTLNNGAILPAIAGKIGFVWVRFNQVSKAAFSL
jgi:hypothetical protein